MYTALSTKPVGVTAKLKCRKKIMYGLLSSYILDIWSTKLM